MTKKATYIHGTHPEEPLSLLNDLTNASFVDFLNISSDQSVLEIGSGLGILADVVAKHLPQCEVIGVEIDPQQMEKSRINSSQTPNLRFLRGDASFLAIKDSSFDIVYCRYILEHVSDPFSVLREAFRVLKHGGKLFIQENNILIHTLYPDCPSYSQILSKYTELQSQVGGDAEIGKKLFSLLKHAGFHSINLTIEPEVHHYGLPTFDLWILNSLEILQGVRDRLLKMDGVRESLFDAAIAELNFIRKDPYGSAYFYWNRACAIKP